MLIGIVLLLRLVLKNRISLRLRYALWLIVLVRLLVPVNFFSSPISVMNVVPEAAPVAEAQQPQSTYTPEVEPSQPVTDTPASQVPILQVNPTPITPETPEVQEPVQIPEQQTEVHTEEKEFSYVLLLQIIWVAGLVITAFVFLFANIRFALRLKLTRQVENAACPLRVYRTAVIDTPCLFGIFRPAIYLTEEAGEDKGRQHILTHELTHYKHLDHIWGVLRCLCLALHWYNPLVWIAAVLSRKDSELACDESVIKQLGEKNRAAYGRTLIRMTCEKQTVDTIFTTATTMTGSKRTITQRIKLIAKHPKTALYAAICLILVAAIAVVCTFTGANPEENTTLTVEKVVITDKPAAEVLTKSYKLEELCAFLNVEIFFESSPMTKNPELPVRLADVHDKFPIECFKEEYIVYSVEEGGYFYVFPDITEPYKVGEQVDFSDISVTNTLYISRVCNVSDFDGIKYGKSSNQDVIDIDPNTITVVDPVSGEIESHSALRDGRVLVISYEKQDDTRSAIVTDTKITSIKNEYLLEWYTRIQYEDWPVDSADKTLTENAETIRFEKYYPKVFECGEVEGYVTLDSLLESKTCRVYARKYRNPDNPYSYDLYVDIDTGTEMLSKQLESNVFQLPSVGIFLGDVDGDKVEEILIHSNTGGNGGYGLWQTWVLKIEDGEIHILFENFDEFDTGFKSRFLEDYRLEITNYITGYNLVFDVKDSHKNAYKSAKEPPTSYILNLDPFCFFEPEDVDHDGISEVVCRQYTSHIGHLDNTGTAHSVLKFNIQTQKFEVIDAWYEPYLGEL